MTLFPKEENKNLAQTYFMLSTVPISNRVTIWLILPCSTALGKIVNPFSHSGYCQVFIQPPLPCPPALLSASAAASTVSLGLHPRQVTSAQCPCLALMVPPGFLPSSLPLLILCPVLSTALDSCLSEHISYIVISPRAYCCNLTCPVYHTDAPLGKCHTSVNSSSHH